MISNKTNKMIHGTNQHGETSEYTYNALGFLVQHTASINDSSTSSSPRNLITNYTLDYTSSVQNNLMSIKTNGVTETYIYGAGLTKIAAIITNTRSNITLCLPSNIPLFDK